ncbi:DNA primase [Mesobacillus boroniphilus JCM 21738]|uniref:DNA primase n=1 Tax=Mesobacillus boroniphilus JCM 21738 TaxID=1294265 RepID=W4RQ57_9BACI|nr:DNA primase [Mesobacillus boroniphilus JCM 21738]
MAERIAEEKVNEIRQAVEIVDVIGDYVQLKKQGRNYFGLCPFHGENSPSFSVSPDKQIYHCFGCGAGGNVFSFLMEIDGLSFQEAAVNLAERADIELKLEGPASGKNNPQLPEGSKLMVEAHELLRKFYHHLLVNTKEGQQALEYLLNRGFTQESIDTFQIGYSLLHGTLQLNCLKSGDFRWISFRKQDWSSSGKTMGHTLTGSGTGLCFQFSTIRVIRLRFQDGH